MNNEICDLLFEEYRLWYQSLARDQGRLPQSLSGISASGLQFIAILEGLNLNHVENANLVKTALRLEQSIAYSYASLYLCANGPADEIKKQLLIVAASRTRYLMEEYDIEERREKPSITLKANGLYTGEPESMSTLFLVQCESVPVAERKRYEDIWNELRKGVQYRNRRQQ